MPSLRQARGEICFEQRLSRTMSPIANHKSDTCYRRAWQSYDHQLIGEFIFRPVISRFAVVSWTSGVITLIQPQLQCQRSACELRALPSTQLVIAMPLSFWVLVILPAACLSSAQNGTSRGEGAFQLEAGGSSSVLSSPDVHCSRCAPLHRLSSHAERDV